MVFPLFSVFRSPFSAPFLLSNYFSLIFIFILVLSCICPCELRVSENSRLT